MPRMPKHVKREYHKIWFTRSAKILWGLLSATVPGYAILSAVVTLPLGLDLLKFGQVRSETWDSLWIFGFILIFTLISGMIQAVCITRTFAKADAIRYENDRIENCGLTMIEESDKT